jgi:hypothetical protein
VAAIVELVELPATRALRRYAVGLVKRPIVKDTNVVRLKYNNGGRRPS